MRIVMRSVREDLANAGCILFIFGGVVLIGVALFALYFAVWIALAVFLIWLAVWLLIWTYRGLSVSSKYIWNRNKYKWEPQIQRLVKPIKIRYNRFINLTICRVINKYILSPLFFVLKKVALWIVED